MVSATHIPLSRIKQLSFQHKALTLLSGVKLLSTTRKWEQGIHYEKKFNSFRPFQPKKVSSLKLFRDVQKGWEIKTMLWGVSLLEGQAKGNVYLTSFGSYIYAAAFHGLLASAMDADILLCLSYRNETC